MVSLQAMARPNPPRWRRTARALLLGAATLQISLAGSSALATTAPSEVAQALPQAEMVGTGRMRYLFWVGSIIKVARTGAAEVLRDEDSGRLLGFWIRLEGLGASPLH